MKYEELLHPWVIVRQVSSMQNLTVKRFRRRNDADECLKALRRFEPDGKFVVLFDASATTGKQS